jgi:predicted ATPase
VEIALAEECRIDFNRRELLRGGAVVPLSARAFDVLSILAKADGAIVASTDLTRLFGPHERSDSRVLHQDIAAIRVALGRYEGRLENVGRSGYRLSFDDGEAVVTKDAREHNRPPFPPAELIGRSEALAVLKALLPQRRALTITGPGGIGKTALALQLVHEMGDWTRERAVFVDLATVLEASFVASAVASAIGLTAGAEVVSAELVAGRIGADRFLLILDNCEHLIDAASAFTGTILRACRNVWVLATSREPLRVDNEHVFRLAPLDVPTPEMLDAQMIYGTAAARLFMARFQGAEQQGEFLSEHAAGIATICRRLDGIPLAIEFAAARAAITGIAGIAENLDDRFRFLALDSEAPPHRHQTLRAALDWSYELLTDVDQSLMRHLGVFSGGFTVDAVVAVIGQPEVSAISTLESIVSLATKSLVVPDRFPGRWRLLETIRAYAMEKLIAKGEADEAARRQAGFFRDQFSSDGPRSLGPLGSGNVARFVGELDNVRAAIDWCFSPLGDSAIGIALTAAYSPALRYLYLMAESADRCTVAIERLNPESDERLLMQLLLESGVALGYARRARGKSHSAAVTALEIATRLGDTMGEFRSLYLLWATQLFGGDVRAATPTADRLLEMALQSGDDLRVAQAERVVGCTMQLAGKNLVARELFERAFARAPTLDPEEYQWPRFNEHAMARAMWGTALWLEGRVDRAVVEVRHAYAEAASERFAASRCNILRMAVCATEIATGHYAAAAQSVALLKDLSERHGYEVFRMTGALQEASLMIKRGDLASGVAALRSTLEDALSGGWTSWFPGFLATLAEGLIGLGLFDDADAVIDDGLSRSEQGGEYWYMPELLRLKGELALRAGPDLDSADRYLDRAALMAAEQHALYWELRVAMSAAKLRRSQGRAPEGRDALASVYNRFTEGFDTPDMVQARELLHAL